MKHLTVFVCLAGAVAIALVASAPVAEAKKDSTPLVCGDVIMEDTKLTEDLECTGYDVGLIIPSPEWGVENITLDLGGHTISGGEEGIGVRAFHTSGTTIKNGTIKGFGIGVAGRGAHDLEVKNLLFTYQTGNGFMAGSRPGFFRPEGVVIKDSLFIGQGNAGVGFGGAKGVEIKDSTFIGSEVAIGFGESEDVSIKNIDAANCYRGVEARNSNNVEIKDSTFHDNLWGTFLETISNAKVSGNHISGCLDGDICCIDEDEEEEECGSAIGVGGSSDISIKNNFIHNAFYGIFFFETDDSVISDNHVYNNLEGGITLADDSTANRIISNITFGTGDGIGDFDLEYDCINSTNNTWKDNSYVFCRGLEINGCTNPCN